MDENIALIKVYQKNQHVTVQGVGGLKGETGARGDAGAGLAITGSVDTYSELPTGLGPDDAGKAWFNQADGKLYVWSGTRFPSDGQGSQFEGPEGPAGPTGFSPSASVSKSGDTTTITITDRNGTTTANVYDGAQLTDGIINGAANDATTVTGSKIALSTVGTPNIRNNAIATDKIADGAVTTAKIANSAVTTTTINNGAVTTDKIANSGVTTAKINDSAVTQAKINMSSITGSTFPMSIRTVQLPYAIQVTLTRIFNVVILTTPTQVNSNYPQSGSGNATESIPAGYRPSSEINIGLVAMHGRGGTGGIGIGANGEIEWYASFTSDGSFRPALSASWLTTDAWPS